MKNELNSTVELPLGKGTSTQQGKLCKEWEVMCYHIYKELGLCAFPLSPTHSYYVQARQSCRLLHSSSQERGDTWLLKETLKAGYRNGGGEVSGCQEFSNS